MKTVKWTAVGLLAAMGLGLAYYSYLVFLAQGYALLALAYFGEEGIPKELDRISLEGVYAAIVDAADHPKVNRDCIALIGGSKGAELALLSALMRQKRVRPWCFVLRSSSVRGPWFVVRCHTRRVVASSH
jgi:hypothetical protein